MCAKPSIAVAHGDGIGPEIMDAVLYLLSEAGADIDIQTIEIGEKIYLKGESAGIARESWEILKNCDAFLKAPITTPQGGGFKSLNVTIRTTLGLFANMRPCVSYYPFIKSKHPVMDTTIIRENEEDLYTGIEYRPTPSVYQALKTISYSGSERIIRFAFEYAKANRRKKVTCFSKDNILKMTDGCFHQIFEEIAKEYPEIENEHWIIDIGSAKLADTPENFDVIVTANLYGDIISDIAAQVAGSVGLAGSANIGESHAMFEAIHGSAPRRAGQNLANPTGLLMGALMMLNHLGLPKEAERIHNAWLKTIEEGFHTYDMYKEGTSREKVGTKEFAQAIAKRLGQAPSELNPAKYFESKESKMSAKTSATLVPKEKSKTLVGCDYFVESEKEAKEIADQVKDLLPEGLALTLIGNRGVGVWPQTHSETLTIDHFRLRIMSQDKTSAINMEALSKLLEIFSQNKVEVTQMHMLYHFDGKPGYTLSQDEQ